MYTCTTYYWSHHSLIPCCDNPFDVLTLEPYRRNSLSLLKRPQNVAKSPRPHIALTTISTLSNLIAFLRLDPATWSHLETHPQQSEQQSELQNFHLPSNLTFSQTRALWPFAHLSNSFFESSGASIYIHWPRISLTGHLPNSAQSPGLSALSTLI